MLDPRVGYRLLGFGPVNGIFRLGNVTTDFSGESIWQLPLHFTALLPHHIASAPRQCGLLSCIYVKSNMHKAQPDLDYATLLPHYVAGCGEEATPRGEGSVLGRYINCSIHFPMLPSFLSYFALPPDRYERIDCGKPQILGRPQSVVLTRFLLLVSHSKTSRATREWGCAMLPCFGSASSALLAAPSRKLDGYAAALWRSGAGFVAVSKKNADARHARIALTVCVFNASSHMRGTHVLEGYMMV